MLRRGWAGLCLIVTVGCAPASVADPGDADAAVPAVADTADAAAAFVPTSHTLPPALPLNGGAVLASANLVVVTFAAYPFADDVEAMADWLPTSSWLAATGAEYGVGTPAVLAKVRLAESAPSFSSTLAFSVWVSSKVGSELPAPPGPNTVYAIVLPAGESFVDPSIGAMCGSFTGYHDAWARDYAFAAIGTCPGHVKGLTDAQQVERVFSHELIEALTDPFGDGYAARDPEDPWTFVSGGEVADVCNGYVHESGFLAVRSWSNAAAAAGLDPCEPNDSPTPYFGVAASAQTTQHVAPGASVTLDLAGFSTAPTNDWAVELVNGASDFTPAITFAPGAMNNGRAAELTVGVPPSATSGEQAVLLLRSLHGGDATYTLQPVVVRVD